MNIVFLITFMFTLAFVHGNNRPCQRNYNNNAYNNFVQRHILQDSFNRNSKLDWEGYLREKDLCRRPRQSFIRSSDQQDVVQICNGSGYRLLGSYQGNLCISASTILVYDLSVDNNCKVKSLTGHKKYVVVACDKIGNRCLPVHFEKYNNQSPDKARHCKP